MKRILFAISLVILFATNAFAIPDFVHIPSQAIYHANFGQASVVLGGQLPNDKFVPSIRGDKWGGEAWVEIFSHEVNVGNNKAVKENGKVKLTVGNETHRFYPLTDESVEYEVEFASRPAKDEYKMRINMAPGVTALWQELTAGEIANGAGYNRPDSEGSYAFYYTKRNGKYKTGKVAHLYRPKLIDNNGDESWCNQSLIGNILTISCDGTWLDNAVYPVILDPELGYSSAGALNFGFSGFQYQWPYQTDSTGGVLSTAHVAIAAVDASQKGVKLAVYNVLQSGTYSPNGLSLVDQVEISTAVVSDDNSASATLSGAVSANTWYGIAWTVQNGNTTVKYDNGAAPTSDDWFYNYAAYGDRFPSTADTHTRAVLNRGYSVWWDYAPAPDGARTKLGYPNMIEDDF